MDLCILGSGNVATHLVEALSKFDEVHIVAIYSREYAHAKVLADKVPGAACIDKLEDLPNAEVYLFALKDCVLADVFSQVKQLGKGLPNSVWIHTAGSLPLSVFGDVKNKAVLYPLQTFSKTRKLDFQEIPVFVEADSPHASKVVYSIANLISKKVSSLDSEKRKYLHLSAVFANNFVNHCFSLAYKLLDNKGIEPQSLFPLIDETVKKLNDLSPIEAQTGPAVRWDENVIEKQKALLSDMPELQEVYEIMTQSIHRLQIEKKGSE